MGLETIVSIIILTLFVIILGLFVWQLMVKKKSADFLLISIVCGVIASVIMVIRNTSLADADSVTRMTLLGVQLIIFLFQQFFLYIFLESLISIKVNPVRLAIVVILITLNILSLHFLIQRAVLLQEFTVDKEFNSRLGDMLWIVSDFCYNILGIVIYCVFGIPIYYNIYKHTKERKAQIFIGALIFIGIGYVLALLKDMNSYFSVKSEFIEIISEPREILKTLGLFIFIITYLLDLNYIYRLPFNTSFLMVLKNNGAKIQSIRLKTERKVDVEDELLSGLISAINNLYIHSVKSKHSIESITSKDTTVLLYSGEYVTGVIVSDKASLILLKSLKKFTTEFEKRYHDLLERETTRIDVFNTSKDLVISSFPYLKSARIE